MISTIGKRFFFDLPATNSSRSMSWYVFNKLRDSSTIAPRTIRKKNEPRPRKIRDNEGKKQKPEKWDPKDLLIECKRPEYNLLKKSDPTASKSTELASHAWFNRHSNGDHFTIHATEKPQDIQSTVKETFDDTILSSEVVSSINNLGYSNPTLAQWRSVKPILAGKHTLIAAETGCGKTLAFLLPMIQQVLEWKSSIPERLNAPTALILTPNRELVKQIYDIASMLAETLPFTPKHLIGGHTKRMMLNPSFEKIDILIGTPTAVSKMTTANILDMTSVMHVVLDEADTLLDDSFNEYIKRFLSKLPIQADCYRGGRGVKPEGAQMTLVSATMPTDISPILSNFMGEESFVKISTPGLHKLMPQVTQTFTRMGKIHKPEHLLKLVKQLHASKTPTLIFSNKSSTSSFVTHFLSDHGISSPCFCKTMPVDLRYETFRKFQLGDTNILSATDIGSRGLNTTKAQAIINYDFPVYLADYLHRCGRVGRIDSNTNGKIFNFVNGPLEIKNVQTIERSVRDNEPLRHVEGNISKLMEEWNDRSEEREAREEIKQMNEMIN